MKYLVLALCLTVAAAIPVDVAVDEEGQEYLLVPVIRERSCTRNRTPGYGTDVTAGGKYNFAGGKNWGADASAGYNRHFGGPGGTGKPQVGAGVNVHGNF
uniref:Uncharacterized protein LOC114340062 n=1 Tax=Diabrotica virgifera virgifera TaxID=50390 RepID=A0A6P7GB81_DIAVI